MTTIPIASATTIVRLSTTRLVVGRSIPIATKRAFSPFAIAKPAGEAEQRAEDPDRQRLDDRPR